MDREAWRAAVHGVAKSRTRLSDFHLGKLTKQNPHHHLGQKLDPSGSFPVCPHRQQPGPLFPFFFFLNHSILEITGHSTVWTQVLNLFSQLSISGCFCFYQLGVELQWPTLVPQSGYIP